MCTPAEMQEIQRRHQQALREKARSDRAKAKAQLNRSASNVPQNSSLQHSGPHGGNKHNVAHAEAPFYVPESPRVVGHSLYVQKSRAHAQAPTSHVHNRRSSALAAHAPPSYGSMRSSQLPPSFDVPHVSSSSRGPRHTEQRESSRGNMNDLVLARPLPGCLTTLDLCVHMLHFQQFGISMRERSTRCRSDR